MKFQKRTKNTFIFISILLILCLSLSGCSNNKDDDKLNEKLESEMEYLDTKLVNMLNKINGIAFKNYIVTSEKVKDQDTSSSGSEQSSSSDSSQSESNGDKASTTSSESANEAEQDASQTSKNNIQYKMESSNVLSRNKTIDWESLKTEIEEIYSSWAIVTLDLYKQKVDSQSILNFNTDLDLATKAIQQQDKVATLNTLSKLYSYIPTYASDFLSNFEKVNVYKTKANILNAYAVIEQNNPDEVKRQLSQAEENFKNIVNNISSDSQNQETINKTYIMLKDIQNSVDPKSIDVFYVKYKNLMEELNILD